MIQHIPVQHLEGRWTPYIWFYKRSRAVGFYRDIGSGFTFIRLATVGKVNPF